MLVLKTTSPAASPSAPKAIPSKYFPSANAKIALTGLTRLRLFVAEAGERAMSERCHERINHNLIALRLFQSAKSHPHAVFFRAGNIFTDVVRLYRHLAVAAIDQHGQAHRLGPARAKDDTKRALNGASGVDNVID